MTKNIFFFLLLGFQVQSYSQNLVPNPGFEEGITCPSIVGNVTAECADWYGSVINENPTLSPTPEWFHGCSEFDFFVPPDVAFGSQEPAGGVGYVGFVTYSTSSVSADFREIVGVELNEPLEIGHQYLVEFEISSLNTAGYYLVTNNIGFNFSTHPFYDDAAFPLNESHFKVDTLIPFTNTWFTISHLFIADSAYTHFHIGNFYDDDNTTVELESDLSQSGYYVVDEVSITSTVLSDGLMNENVDLNLYPNPASDRLSLDLGRENLSNGEIFIYDTMGKMIEYLPELLISQRTEIEIRELPKGTYLILVVTDKQSYRARFVKI